MSSTVTDRYRAMLADLYPRSSRGIRPGLERVRDALDRTGLNELPYDVVHVAGTNGKGSVSRMIAAGLGESVGLFTSPHLHRLTERFVVDGREVDKETLVALWQRLQPTLDEVPLTFFETVTVLALHLFAEARVRWVVLEVGLGGRLDSTNVVAQPRLTAITQIGLDHAAYLGDTLADIAREKAGILKPGVACVVGSQSPEVDRVLNEVSAQVGARLAGAHQCANAAVALAALWTLERSDDALARALEADNPGRLERIDNVILDAAHNLDGARVLAAHFGPRAVQTLVFGAMRDKPAAEMLDILRPCAERVVVTQASLDRALEVEAFARPSDIQRPRVDAALQEAQRGGGLVLVAGSCFVVAEARARLLGLEADPPIPF